MLHSTSNVILLVVLVSILFLIGFVLLLYFIQRSRATRVDDELRPSIKLTNNNANIETLTSRKSNTEINSVDFFQFASSLIDRPLNASLQPLPGMGPVLMKINVNEQHWIR